jgi:hypothetical protein
VRLALARFPVAQLEKTENQNLTFLFPGIDVYLARPVDRRHRLNFGLDGRTDGFRVRTNTNRGT